MLFFVTVPSPISFFFFFNDTATTEIYTLSLHDALPISIWPRPPVSLPMTLSLCPRCWSMLTSGAPNLTPARSEEHTSELQSQSNLVCRLLLEKKKKTYELNRSRASRRRYE